MSSLQSLSRDSSEKNSLLSPIPGSAGSIRSFSTTQGAGASTTLFNRPNSSDISLSGKYSLAADPREWGTDITMNTREPDDDLHNPDPNRDRKSDSDISFFSGRGMANLGCLAILAMLILGLFAGFPIISFLTKPKQSHNGGFNIGGLNATEVLIASQDRKVAPFVPALKGNFGLIDRDTPQDAYTAPSMQDGSSMTLVFSDEFNQEGRSFYPGDDPFWEAVDLHYWGTNNLEWYDPASITTEGGALVVTLSEVDDPTINHNMDYRGGMMSTWNKFCFTGGQVLASVNLPGPSNVVGLWPAIWSMGNLGRAGFGASLEGMWPYSYDNCDVGTLKNQSMDGLTPEAAFTSGPKEYNFTLSYLPGQRLSRCTCPGESHPGPVHKDGTYVGRAAPEIDMFEATVENGIGRVSQSGQWAPFTKGYEWPTDGNMEIMDATLTDYNTYKGAVFQQASSCVTTTDQQCYEATSNCMSTYGFEYKPGFDDSYLAWMSNAKVAWKMKGTGMAPDNDVKIAARPVPQEPMIANQSCYMFSGVQHVTHAVYKLLPPHLPTVPNHESRSLRELSVAFDFADLTFPVKMSVDWIRVYQDPNHINVGCDPADFPTKAYIEEYLEAYTNPNLTTWADPIESGGFGQVVPKNNLIDNC
ncbi:hypothetical protein D9758_003867 [Tetrapyrgos nigripes]|uniref:GH16 domain-containing protein n=1 Tax=Tetrapyrgos nigripes TaxID=182062 RepID=A0A8H5GLA6_9AGAR|nr:hypothetical protein D9758_003867 [Tetrapyrgos nigripes]